MMDRLLRAGRFTSIALRTQPDGTIPTAFLPEDAFARVDQVSEQCDLGEVSGRNRQRAMPPFPAWHSGPQIPALGNDEVHVWRASLDLPAPQVSRLQDTLSTDELTRADRYYLRQVRERFVVARGLLRAILSRYLGVAAGHLRFCYGPNGKPKLDKEPGGESLRFNVTHSQELALYAIARDREVGIDVEYILPDLAGEEIAEQFSHHERSPSCARCLWCCSPKPFLTVGRARKPTSRQKGLASRCPWISLTYR